MSLYGHFFRVVELYLQPLNTIHIRKILVNHLGTVLLNKPLKGVILGVQLLLVCVRGVVKLSVS